VKERLLKYAKYAGPVGYPLFYVVCLMVFASFTFPYRRLKEHVIASFNAAQRDSASPQELQIDDMGGYWLSGIKMSGVALLMAAPEPGKPPTRIDIDEATVRYSLLPMLVGSSDVSFDVVAFGGEASGSYEISGKDQTVDVSLDSIDVSKVEPLVSMLGVPLAGKLGGHVHLTIPEGKASKGVGSIALEIKDAAVGDGKAKIKNALALPRVNIGTLTFAADAKDGVLKITKFVAGGSDLDVQGEGRITMRELATDSLSDVQVRFRINDAYRTKSDVTTSLFGAPGSNVPPLFELVDPKIKQSKRADGFYGWSIRGPLTRLEFIPAGGTGGPSMAPMNLGLGLPKGP
jgi:type II secretion system protein N